MTWREPANDRIVVAVSGDEIRPEILRRTMAVPGVERIASARRACASAGPSPSKVSERVTIGRAGSGWNSKPPSPEGVKVRRTNPFVSDASAKEVRSIEPESITGAYPGSRST